MNKKEIYSARDATEAHFVKGLLEAEGIDAEVRGEAMEAVKGILPTAQIAPSVWVWEEDADAAGEIIESFRRGERPMEARPAWRCPHCGEQIEGQFSHCWKCGASRDEPEEPQRVVPFEESSVLEYERHRPMPEDDGPDEEWVVDEEDEAEEDEERGRI